MKFLGTIARVFASVCAAVAESPAAAAWMSHVDAQVIVVPQKEALKLLDDLYDADKVENAYKHYLVTLFYHIEVAEKLRIR